MKKILITTVSLLMAVAMFAQKDVTQFLGIPVDGSKQEMIQKLKTKGFQYNNVQDRLEGEFNGHDVYISVVTNNNKVWRIMVKDKFAQSEGSIKIRFNTLCRQFNNNKKYMPFSEKDYMLSDDEDISYEMSVHAKRYEASYVQLPTDTTGVSKFLQEKFLSTYTEEQIRSFSEEEAYKKLRHLYLTEVVFKKFVWFMIDKDINKYVIIMYYDNEYNHSNGEDL